MLKSLKSLRELTAQAGLILAALVLCASQAAAQISTSGDVTEQISSSDYATASTYAVGANASGSMTVAAGGGVTFAGTLNQDYFYVGSSSGAAGSSLNITGGQFLQTDGNIVIGQNGSGVMNIDNGGAVLMTFLILGHSAGGVINLNDGSLDVQNMSVSPTFAPSTSININGGRFSAERLSFDRGEFNISSKADSVEIARFSVGPDTTINFKLEGGDGAFSGPLMHVTTLSVYDWVGVPKLNVDLENYTATQNQSVEIFNFTNNGGEFDTDDLVFTVSGIDEDHYDVGTGIYWVGNTAMLDISIIPEPNISAFVMGAGVLALAFARRKRV